MEAMARVMVSGEPIPPVFADHDRLEQVLVNLMDNAIRHNGADTKVAVRTWRPNPHSVAITVVDDGVGLPPDIEDIGRPAEPRSPTSGAGLGLSISRAIVAAHGGRLRLERPARGTCWHIELDLADVGPDSEPATAEAVDG
jgi:signal transduction histidine kinase